MPDSQRENIVLAIIDRIRTAGYPEIVRDSVDWSEIRSQHEYIFSVLEGDSTGEIIAFGYRTSQEMLIEIDGWFKVHREIEIRARLNQAVDSILNTVYEDTTLGGLALILDPPLVMTSAGVKKEKDRGNLQIKINVHYLPQYGLAAIIPGNYYAALKVSNDFSATDYRGGITSETGRLLIPAFTQKVFLSFLVPEAVDSPSDIREEGSDFGARNFFLPAMGEEPVIFNEQTFNHKQFISKATLLPRNYLIPWVLQ